MAPTKTTTRSTVKHSSAGSGVLTQMAAANAKMENGIDQSMDIAVRGKRKAEISPIKNEKIKRSALGNLTNNVNASNSAEERKPIKKELNDIGTMKKDVSGMMNGGAVVVSATTTIVDEKPPPIMRQPKINTRAITRSMMNGGKNEDVENMPTMAMAMTDVAKVATIESAAVEAIAKQKPTRRISNEFKNNEESLYMSALEDVSLSVSESVRLLSDNFQNARRRSALLTNNEKSKTDNVPCKSSTPTLASPNGGIDIAAIVLDEILSPFDVQPIPDGVNDFDKEHLNDPFQVSEYAMDIFNYLKSRERAYTIADYMVKQVHLSKWMRTLLVDWMVEVQETFELNHETLYLAVKIVDIFLGKVVISKDKLQLVGAAALFIACKFDERTPPHIDDFLYICDGAYKHKELIRMEVVMLRVIDYDLGMPLSYRFLRRYARCAKVSIPTLTLARYILEMALMDYDTIQLSDSKMASAALFIANRMQSDENAWTPTLEYYSGYKLIDFVDIVPILNAGLLRKHKTTIKTIKSKYSHIVFHEVAKIPLLSTEKLLEPTEFKASLLTSNVKDD